MVDGNGEVYLGTTTTTQAQSTTMGQVYGLQARWGRNPTPMTAYQVSVLNQYHPMSVTTFGGA